MTFVLGAALAAGLLLALSPWLWPATVRRRSAGASGRLARLLDEAGLGRVAPGRFVLASGGIAALLAAVVWIVAPLPAFALVAASFGACAPLVWVRSRRIALQRRRRGLWPDVCDLLIASVRAGMSLPDAVASLAECAPAELRTRFAVFARDLAASGHFDSSAGRLKAGLADPVADRIIETLRMARQVGGTDVATVLRSLAAAVRADASVRSEVEARQSWTRGAAALGVAAPWVVLALLALRPEGAEAYASPEGVVLVLAGAAVSIVAYRMMLAIGRLPEPKRWLGA